MVVGGADSAAIAAQAALEQQSASTWSPLIGDYPPRPALPPFTPWYPQTVPSIGTGSTTTQPPKGRTMDVHMIWASDDNGNVWLEFAMDTDSMADNPLGWSEALENAYNTYGGSNVRVTITSVNFEAVQKAFNPVVV